MKLCTQILAVVEKQPSLEPTPVGVEGREPQEVNYHLMLLNEAGLIEAEMVEHANNGQSRWLARRLTWAGYDFLENQRAIERRTGGGLRC
jgi:DNA-binding transcriptional ArsR family regulator